MRQWLNGREPYFGRRLRSSGSKSVRYGSGNDRKGLVADVGAGLSMPVTPALRAGV